MFPSDGLSDHMLEIADLKYLKQTITYRNTKNIDLDKFKLDIQKSDLITDPKHSIAELYNQFHKTLESLLDCHAPLKTKTVSQKPQNPWRTDKIDVAKRKRRQLERVWRRTRLPTDRSKYSKQLHLCNRLMANERRQYIRKQIHESEKKSNKLWATVSNILHREAMPSMPDLTDLPSFCASFSSFFVDKIEKKRLKFCTNNRKPEFIPPPEI